MGINNCIDAGTEYCPCYLAEKGECIMCSQLQGKAFCDCPNWQGVCIYREYIWHNARSKERRLVHLCPVSGKEQIAPLVTLLEIKVKKALARELNQPGAFVFLRDPGRPIFFDLPMSVMWADERRGVIKIAVQKRGLKTKYLLDEAEKGRVLLRGPYWNGVLGLPYLKSFQGGKALLVVRGIGQAPALPVAKKLLRGKNKVEVLLDKGKIGIDFTGDFFREMGCQVYPRELCQKDYTLSEKTRVYLRDRLAQGDLGLVYAGGSELLQQGIYDLLPQEGQQVCFVCSNNAQLCCGEGICGSCQTRLADGSGIRRCKTQLDPAIIYQGR